MATVFDIRRANLITLLQRYPSTADFNVAVGKKRNAPGFTMIKNRAMNGDKVRVMGDALAREVEKKLSLPIGWMDIDHQSVGYINEENVAIFPMKTLKLAGADTMKEERVFLDNDTLAKHFPDRGRNGLAAAIVHDEAMAPTLLLGDRVLIDETQNKYTTDGIYCIEVHGALLLRRIQFALDGRHQVYADSAPADKTPLEMLDSIKIIGRVCAVWNFRSL